MITQEQCEAYYKALEEGDIIKANFLYLPPVIRPSYFDEFEEKLEEIKENYQL